MEQGTTSSPRAAATRATRGAALVAGTLLTVLVAVNCAGRSTRDEASEHGGDSGGASAGGASLGGSGDGSSTGATSGTGPITTTACGAPVAQGTCRGYEPSYWFDASTGVCMPFTYTGCDGNANRFATMEECYATCDPAGRGSAACDGPTDCRTVRLAEPCCTTDVREFVSVRRDADFTCTNPILGCTACAADCASTPFDGTIGSTCTAGHCIPFDARSLGFDACSTDADCYLRFGVDCCEDCAENLPSKLVALSAREELSLVACGPDRGCQTSCELPSTAYPQCNDGHCGVGTTAPAP